MAVNPVVIENAIEDVRCTVKGVLVSGGYVPTKKFRWKMVPRKPAPKGFGVKDGDDWQLIVQTMIEKLKELGYKVDDIPEHAANELVGEPVIATRSAIRGNIYHNLGHKTRLARWK